MGRDDWYRRTTWSSDDQRNFLDRLKRSRGPYNKAQYLRIQALHLQQSGLHRDALELLNVLNTEFADQASQATLGFKQKAECLWAIGDQAASFEAYVQALAAQRKYPNIICAVALSFAERFCDVANGAYRDMLLKEMRDEIERAHLIGTDSQLRYGTLMIKLLDKSPLDEAQEWQRIVEEARKQSVLDALPVIDRPRHLLNTPAQGSTSGARITKKKSEFAATLDEIQGGLRSILRGLGFRARGRTFNRLTSDGLTQVINIQMGPFDPPGATHLPGFTNNLYGQFTINLGVFVPEVWRWRFELSERSFVQELDCCIRARIGDVCPEQRDLWWHIERSDSLMAELCRRLETYALPFLNEFATRADILVRLAGEVVSGWAEPTPRIVRAIILRERGEIAEARRLLAEQVVSTNHTGHAQYVRELAQKLGLGDLQM